MFGGPVLRGGGLSYKPAVFTTTTKPACPGHRKLSHTHATVCSSGVIESSKFAQTPLLSKTLLPRPGPSTGTSTGTGASTSASTTHLSTTTPVLDVCGARPGSCDAEVGCAIYILGLDKRHRPDVGTAVCNVIPQLRNLIRTRCTSGMDASQTQHGGNLDAQVLARKLCILR